MRSTPLELGQSQCCQRRLRDRAEFGTGPGPEFDGLVGLGHWIGLREKLQETMVFTIEYWVFL